MSPVRSRTRADAVVGLGQDECEMGWTRTTVDGVNAGTVVRCCLDLDPYGPAAAHRRMMHDEDYIRVLASAARDDALSLSPSRPSVACRMGLTSLGLPV
jgi:hypothetical protein